MDYVLVFGIVAGVLQLLGYVLYLSIENIEPNPVTWFMFAYGTALLTVLEFDASASFALLLLPITCSLLAIYVAIKCWQKARLIDPARWWPRDWWPESVWDRAAFVTDIVLTILYVGLWVVAVWDPATEDIRILAILAFLWLSNISTIPSFVPIIRSTMHEPHKEHYLPWFVWTAAYLALLIATLASSAEYTDMVFYALIAYPAINAVMHGLIAVIAYPSAVKER